MYRTLGLLADSAGFLSSSQTPDHAGVIVVASGTLDSAREIGPGVEVHCQRRVGWLGAVERGNFKVSNEGWRGRGLMKDLRLEWH